MEKFLKGNGDFRKLKVYKVSVVISVATEIFIKKYFNYYTRTKDQMQQAARSCKQNLIEGHEAALTSRESEIKLTNVARASLGELMEDYLDQLRFLRLEPWQLSHPRIEKLRNYLKTDEFLNEYQQLLERLNVEEFCNLMITLIKQEQFLIDGLLKRQQERFLHEGGLREQMTRSRLEVRKNQT